MPTSALIIDDNPMNIDVLCTLLENEGVEVTSIPFPSRLNAIRELDIDFDVIFLDLEFPNDNGFETLQIIKEDDRFQDVPVVAYTVHTSEINEARLAGFDSFLGKPIKIEKFPEQLRQILNRQPVWDN